MQCNITTCHLSRDHAPSEWRLEHTKRMEVRAHIVAVREIHAVYILDRCIMKRLLPSIRCLEIKSQ